MIGKWIRSVQLNKMIKTISGNFLATLGHEAKIAEAHRIRSKIEADVQVLGITLSTIEYIDDVENYSLRSFNLKKLGHTYLLLGSDDQQPASANLRLPMTTTWSSSSSIVWALELLDRGFQLIYLVRKLLACRLLAEHEAVPGRPGQGKHHIAFKRLLLNPKTEAKRNPTNHNGRTEQGELPRRHGRESGHHRRGLQPRERHNVKLRRSSSSRRVSGLR